MKVETFSIGELAHRTGCKVPTIRYYEEIEVLPTPLRNSANQRRYEQRHLDRLAFVRHARDLGFGLDQIRDLIALCERPDLPCTDVDVIAREHLKAVEGRISRLQTLRKELKRVITECSGNQICDCRIIESLANHDQ